MNTWVVGAVAICMLGFCALARSMMIHWRETRMLSRLYPDEQATRSRRIPAVRSPR
ncbi:hypothetical protein [Burkholderia sp. Bp9140]|uniref:hypothetical protein n=1 Tax=Burkholderia sp. Bp9140 TaxID=2184572 RepID=UPI00162767BB|nr:hypothetical protein [Burkholderia sp. Bp9140]